MEESILTSVKRSIGITEEYEHFDEDIKMHINTVFNILHQLGAGPEEGYCITDKTNTWNEFTENKIFLELVKSYVCLKVKTLFDPPTVSSLTESINRSISELEWRINVTVDPKTEGKNE